MALEFHALLRKRNLRTSDTNHDILETFAYDSLHHRRFSGDESFLRDPNAFNDAANEKAIEGEGIFIKGSGPKI